MSGPFWHMGEVEATPRWQPALFCASLVLGLVAVVGFVSLLAVIFVDRVQQEVKEEDRARFEFESRRPARQHKPHEGAAVEEWRGYYRSRLREGRIIFRRANIC